MKKFYFFKVELRQNIQGELRKVVLPLPGQTTYVTLSDRNHPVDTNLKVQLALRQNTLVCSLPGIEDVVIGVCHEGNREKDLRLIQQSRMQPTSNEENAHTERVYFYRTEAQVFLVKRPEWFLDQEVSMPLADDEMLRAYEALAGSRPDTGAPQQTATAPGDETPAEAEPASAFDPTAFAPDSEISMVEDHLRLGRQESTAMEIALNISRLRDRMRAGVVAFFYMKQNGSLREAYGTRNPDVIRLLGGNTDLSARRPDASMADGTHFHYFDIQRGDWRMFCTEDFQYIRDENEVVPAHNTAKIRQISYMPISES